MRSHRDDATVYGLVVFGGLVDGEHRADYFRGQHKMFGKGPHAGEKQVFVHFFSNP